MAIPMSHVPTSIFSSVASHELVQTPSFPEDPSQILGRNTPKTIERVVPVSGVFGDVKKNFVEHCWTSLSSPCKTETITWNLHDKSSFLIKFPIAKRASVFWTSIWHCPPPQSFSVFISWGNVELHSHEVRHPKKHRPRHSKRCQENANGDCKHTGKLFLAIQDPKGQKIQKLVCTAKTAQDTQVQSESLRKSVGQIPGNPAEQWQWYYRNESLCQGRALVQNHFFWGHGYGIPYSSGARGGWHNQSLWHALPQGDSIELSIIRVNRSAEDRWNLSQHLHVHDWWYLGTSQGKTTSTQSKSTTFISYSSK